MSELYYNNKKNMFRLVFPIFIEQLLSATIGIADTIMVSSTGDAGVSAVSNVDTISTLMIQIFAAVATGATVVISQCMGADDRKKANSAARQAIMLVLAVSVAISAGLLLGGRGLLEAVYGNKDQAITDYAVPYFMLSAISFPFMAIFQTCSGILRGTGKATPPMTVATIMNVINISGNALFIYGFGMETTGAALSTLIARMFGAVVMIILLASPQMEVNIRGILPIKLDGSLMKAILFISLPTAIENALFNIGKIITQSFVNDYGAAEIAANAVVWNIFQITMIASTTMCLASTTVVGYCVGHGNAEESKKFTYKFAVANGIAMVILNLLMFIFMKPLLSFYKVSPEAIELAKIMMISALIITPVIHPWAFNVCYALRAAGDVKFTMVVAVLSMFIFRVALGYVFGTVLGMGAFGTWISMYIDWLCRVIFFVPRISSKRRKIKNLVK